MHFSAASQWRRMEKEMKSMLLELRKHGDRRCHGWKPYGKRGMFEQGWGLPSALEGAYVISGQHLKERYRKERKAGSLVGKTQLRVMTSWVVVTKLENADCWKEKQNFQCGTSILATSGHGLRWTCLLSDGPWGVWLTQLPEVLGSTETSDSTSLMRSFSSMGLLLPLWCWVNSLDGHR